MKVLRTAPVVALIAAPLLLAACGGGGSKRATPAQTIVVDATEFKLEPSVSVVKPGTYEFKGVNKGTVPHVVELEGQGVEEETDEIQPGESKTIELTLDRAGEYKLYCPIDDHEENGMVTKFTVKF